MISISLKDCNCSQPRLIFNPNFKDLILSCDYLYLNSQRIFIEPVQRYCILNGDTIAKVFHICPPQPPLQDDLDDSWENYVNSCYFVNSDSGDCFPLFQLVKCGKCDACLASKLNGYLQRSRFALLESERPALFLTLTYNSYHVPYHGVNIRHIQLFKKRLKQLITRYFSSDDASKLKFICVSEYGKYNHRPHYHVLVYGFPIILNDVTLRYHMIQYCWRESYKLSNGRWYSFDEYRKDYPKVFKRPPNYDPFSFGFINLSEVDSMKQVGYVLKYQLKDNEFKHKHWFDGVTMHPNFLTVSENLGLDYVLKYSDSILDSKDSKFTYHDWTTNTVVNCDLCGYYLKKLFPSFSSLIPCDLRKNFRQMASCVDAIIHLNDFDSDLKKSAFATRSLLHDKFPFLSYNYCFDSFESLKPDMCFLRELPQDNSVVKHFVIENKAVFNKSFIVDEFIKSSDYLFKAPMIDFKWVLEQVAKRDLVLSRMSRAPADPSSVGNRFNKQNKVLISKSKL